MKGKLQEVKVEEKPVGAALDNAGDQRGLCPGSYFQGLPVGESALDTDIPSSISSGLDQREAPSAGGRSEALKTEGRSVVGAGF